MAEKRISRRDLLKAAGAVAVTPLLPGCSGSLSSDQESSASSGFSATESGNVSFQHGVASGDPLSDRVILWTRVTPENADFTGQIEVLWEISADESFSHTLNGTVQTSPTRDFTVKVDPSGLLPATPYYYRFICGGITSPVGRTRTAPSGMADRLRFVVASCSNYGVGFFHAYRRIAERTDIDAVLHLGDYIYEYGDGEFEGDGLCFFRGCEPPHEIVTLDDYRQRYAQYRGDPDLQEAHRVHPWIVTWDDHEFANNTWKDGAENHNEPEEGPFHERKAIASRVFDEWMPIRLPEPGNPERVFRRLDYGGLVDLMVLDTRVHGRDKQVNSVAPILGVGTTEPAVLDDPNRYILGTEQFAWLQQRLASSTAIWKLLGQQVIFAPLQMAGEPFGIASGTVINSDAWDGYRASRNRVLDIMEGSALENVVILTGDVHSSWGMDVPRDPYNPALYNPATGDGSLAVEFVTPAITMFGVPGQELAQLSNPHLQYVNTTANGYMLIELTPDQVTTQWWHVSDVRQPDGIEYMGRELTAQAGNNHIDRIPA